MMQTKRQSPESQELMLQLTRKLVDQDIDRIINGNISAEFAKKNNNCFN
jgi:hypothetical protein